MTRAHEKVVRQEEESKQAAAEEEEPGEDLCNLSAYNMARSLKYSMGFGVLPT